MRAILITLRTKYACNLSQDGDHICLQSRKFLNSFLTQDDHFQGVLKIFEIAGIFGSYYNQNSKQNSNQNSKHNQSPPIHLRDSHLRLNQRWAFSQQIQILYRIYNRIHNRIWLSHLTLDVDFFMGSYQDSLSFLFFIFLILQCPLSDVSRVFMKKLP